jgi:hypothetical protein
MYSDKSERINSFQNWTGTVAPHELASAGFWFTKNGDVVTCWKCLVAINNWIVDDDPWLEHIKHSRDCELVQCYVKTYEGRLHSFKDWQGGDQATKSMMSFAGFFYTGSGDTTETSCCRRIVKKWDRRHAAMEIHKKLEPKCEMMSFFPKIPTDYMSTFRELDLDDKTKRNLISHDIYYEKFTSVFVCNECQYSTLDCRVFVHDLNCKNNIKWE